MQQSPRAGAAHSYSNEVEALTEKIIACYRRTTAELVVIGGCLKKLKQIMPYKEYVAHVEGVLGMSATQAVRLISLFEKLDGRTNDVVLGAKPAVLYVLVESKAKDVDRLIDGREITLNGERKTVADLTLKEAKKLTAKKKYEPKWEIEREIATLFEEMIDECAFYILEAKAVKSIPNRSLLIAYVKEVQSCLAQLEKVLR